MTEKQYKLAKFIIYLKATKSCMHAFSPPTPPPGGGYRFLAILFPVEAVAENCCQMTKTEYNPSIFKIKEFTLPFALELS